MEKPDLGQMWETWIKIGLGRNVTQKMIQDTIRREIGSTFPRLLAEGKINWYHFLIHQYPRDPNNLYFHIRFSPAVKEEDLPDYCVPPKKIALKRDIAGINKSLLKNEEIEEAWRIIGEQSEWVINLMNIHKEDSGWIPIDQMVQFMHFYFNMLGLSPRGRISLHF